MTKRFFAFLTVIFIIMRLSAADPMSTSYSFEECQASLRPYPLDVKPTAYPDSLMPVMINHVGRHGARYAASSTNTEMLKRALDKAAASGTITPLGKRLLSISDEVISLSRGKWGALDSLGEYEQRMLASRMYNTFRPVFDKAVVNAISSYSPRVMMSMYSFTHQLDRLSNKIEFTTSTGRKNSYLMRPFDTSEEFQEFYKSAEVMDAYNSYFKQACPVTAIERVLGKDYEYSDADQKRNLAITEYYVLAGLSAMSYECDLTQFFTLEEINSLWSCFNLRQYLQRTATTLSSVPADIATDLLKNIIDATDDFIDGRTRVNVFLRFGHAETLLPLVSLMRLPGCYYMTNYFDTVARNWQDFNIVPMAANVHLILFKNEKNGKYYVRLDLNEQPLAFIPNSDAIYVPWDTAHDYLTRCLPIHMR